MGGSGKFDVTGQTVIVAGGSKGLGRELAIRLVSQGANVIILARGKAALEQTKAHLLTLRKDPAQTVEAHVVHLATAPEVEHFISSLPSTSLPTALFCVAGGTAQEIGFFADISPSQIRACLEKNYLSAAFITNALLKRWLVHPPHPSVTRHIIFTASTAAFLSLPGYAAYTPSKTATRALADTLRQELLLYRHQQEIRVHCSFPGTIFTESFVEEQLGKPELCKQLEGSDDPKNGLTPGQVADRTLKGLEQGKYFITMDGDTQILLNNMRGPSPRDSAVWEWVLGFVGSLVWPFYRRSWDRKTVAHGRENGVGGTGKS